MSAPRLRRGLAKALRTLRLRAKLTQEQLEPIVTRRHISHLEHGTKSPTLDTIELIAARVGVRPLTLLLYAQLLAGPANKRLDTLDQVTAEVRALVDQDASARRS